MKTFNIRKCSHNLQVAENGNISIYMNGSVNFYSKGAIVVTLNNRYLEEVTINDDKIVNTFKDSVIDEMIFNSELKRKNKYVLDGNSFVYKNDLYICLDNEDYSIKEVLHYNHDTYKSFATVITINGINIWVAITRNEEKYNENAKKDLDNFFKDNGLLGYNCIYSDRLLMLSDDKKNLLIDLLMTKKV